MFTQYNQTVEWDSALINLGLNPDNLATCGQKTTSGAPSATAGKFIKGCFIQNIATGVLYCNTGTTASPVWSIIDTATGGLPALTEGTMWIGDDEDSAVEVAVAYALAGGAPQALTGAGAINLTAFQTRFTSTGTGNALTLADATQAGLTKKVSYVAEGGGTDTGVITPATPSGFATVTLNAIGDYVVFRWNGLAWVIQEFVGATVA